MTFINRLTNSYFQKYGTDEDKEALKKLGNSDYDAKKDKLKEKYDIDTFEGNNLKAFKKSALKDIFDAKELEQLFKILDADGSGDLSERELADLAALGSGKSKDKIDNSDIKQLMKIAKNEARGATKNEKETDKHDDGTKTVTTTRPDGTVVVSEYDKNGHKTKETKTTLDGKVTTTDIEYDKDGKKVKSTKKRPDGSTEVLEFSKDGKVKSSVKTLEDGTTTTTKYLYDADGNLISTQAETKKDNEVLERSEAEYNKKGKIKSQTVKDANGNVISTTKFKYNNDGKLISEETKTANGKVATNEYNPETGKKKSRTVTDDKGNILSETEYDENGHKKTRKSYKYDKEGNKTGYYLTEFKNNEPETRKEYDANGKVVTESTYDHTKKDSVTRIDKDPETKETKRKVKIVYDESGKVKYRYIDKNGDGTYDVAYSFDANGNRTEIDVPENV